MPEPDELNDPIRIAHFMAYPKLNIHLQRRIEVCSVNSSDGVVAGQVVRSDFDSHANMVVFGK